MTKGDIMGTMCKTKDNGQGYSAHCTKGPRLLHCHNLQSLPCVFWREANIKHVSCYVFRKKNAHCVALCACGYIKTVGIKQYI